MKGVDHRDEISMTDITTGVWFSMFEDFEYNPLLPLIKPPYVHTTIRKTDLGDAEEWKYGSWKPKLQPAEFELKNLGDLKIKDIEQVLQAIEYLNFVDWFNGTNPVRQMAVKGIYNNFAEYNSFIDKYISSSDRAKGSTDSTFKDEVKAEANRLLKPLYRNPYLDRSKRGKNAQGKTKKVGGKLTEEGEKILFKWLSISNQDPTLINSVKLEA